LLIEKGFVDPATIVNCRLSNNSIQKLVDETLHRTQPWWLYMFYEFETAEEIEQFVNFATTLQPTTSPFLAHSCSIDAQNRQCCRTTVPMFEAYGQHLSHVRLNLDFATTPRYFFRKVLQLLEHLPNVEMLELVGHLQLTGDQLRRQRHVIVGLLPDLPKLKLLSLKLFGANESQAPIIIHILRKYGHQLISFSGWKFVFLARIPPIYLSMSLCNVQHLHISRLNMSSTRMFLHLSVINMPALKILELRREFGNNPQDIIFSIETLQALSNFRSRLEHLIMESVNDEFLEIPPSVFGVLFPELTRLTLCTSNARLPSNMWTYFEGRLPKLELVHFETGVGRNRNTIPASQLLKPFFEKFPLLNKITWTHAERPMDVVSYCSRIDAMSSQQCIKLSN